VRPRTQTAKKIDKSHRQFLHETSFGMPECTYLDTLQCLVGNGDILTPQKSGGPCYVIVESHMGGWTLDDKALASYIPTNTYVHNRIWENSQIVSDVLVQHLLALFRPRPLCALKAARGRGY
jgi:hypothetical protein